MATIVHTRRPAAAGTAGRQQVKELHVTSPLMAGPARDAQVRLGDEHPSAGGATDGRQARGAGPVLVAT